MAEESSFQTALAHKWLGVDAGEYGGQSKGGDAVAYVALAKKELEDLTKEQGSGISLGGKERREKSALAEELSNVTVFLRHYKRVNDSVRIRGSVRVES